MRFSESFINEIKLRVPISRIVGSKLSFDAKKTNSARGNYWACCPFHIEKTPSFSCNDNKGNYYCYGCHASGDIFSFLMQIEGLSFFQAIEKLASFAGLELPKNDIVVTQQDKLAIYQVLDTACEFFEKLLNQAQGEKARLYLANRNLTQHTIKEFRLGYASEQKFLLKNSLNKLGISDEQLLAAGLLVKNEQDNRLYERFVGRIMFPIKDKQGRIIAFGGRALADGAKAKYINTAQTSVFFKGRTLYNLQAAQDYCYQNRKRGAYDKNISKNESVELIVVEGYMDVIALSQAGIKNVVAPLGTALSEEQMKIIWQSSLHPILCFDGDIAGQRAAQRTMQRMLPILDSKVTLHFALLEAGKDPDDIIKSQGKEAFLARINSAHNALDFMWQNAIADIDVGNPEKCAAMENGLLLMVQTIKDSALKQHYLSILKARLRQFFFEARRNKIVKTKNELPYSLTKALEAKLNSNLEAREHILIVILLYYPELIAGKIEELRNIEFTNQDLAKICQTMIMKPHLKASNIRIWLEEQIPGIKLALIEERVSHIGIALKEDEVNAKKILEQILYLYNKMHILKEGLIYSGKQIHDEQSFFAMLANIKKTLRELETSFMVRD